MELSFKKATNKAEIEEAYNYNIDAFSDSPDFNWTLDAIINETKEGWEVWKAIRGEEIIAVAFIKKDEDTLLTKNTSVKMNYQGYGYSHKIKLFLEKKAKEMNVTNVIHYCSIDDFRMYSLNESHGYQKSPIKDGKNGLVVQWNKKL